MYTLNLGSLDAKQLTLDFNIPLVFCAFTHGKWRVRYRSLCNPVKWLSWLRNHEHTLCWSKRYSDANHRCYCRDGSMYDGRFGFCGFAVTWFYSHYTGEIPCSCDKVLADMREKEVVDGND